MPFHAKHKKEESSSESGEDSSENESDHIEESDSEEELIQALQDAMKNTIIFSIQGIEEDEDDDWEPEESGEENGEDTDNESEEESEEEMSMEIKEIKEKKKPSTSSKRRSRVRAEKEHDDEPDKASEKDVESRVEPRRQQARKSKTKAFKKMKESQKETKKKSSKASKNENEKDTSHDSTKQSGKNKGKNKPKEKADKTKDDKNDKDTKDDFDFEKAMTEFKSIFDTKEGVPSIMKEHAEKLETEYKKRQEKREKREKRKKLIGNSKEFRELLRKKRTESDISFFRKLPLETQSKYIEEFRKLKDASSIKKPYTIKLLESPIPVEFKSVAFKKVAMLETMEPGFGEYFKVKQWVDTFMQIPFGVNHTLSVSLEQDGVDKCHEFMSNAKETLDKSVYGLNDAKMQIMQLLGQFMTNPSSVGTAIAIKGPMGTGKTTLVKEGISKVLNRPFVFIPLGGATDSSYLEGHSYTYEGSTWGRIVDSLVQCKSMNPVFYFDELDKVSDTPRGEEIIGILTHLTDTTQNGQYHDKYFADLDFDLSKALFIFSYNHEEKVNSILRDRMYRIETKGYEKKDKIIIARKYLIPKIVQNVKFNEEDITIPDSTLDELIEHHTDNEKGVRNLKRCLETIYTKLNLYRLMPSGSNLFEEDLTIHVSFPFTVTTEGVKHLLKKGEEKQSFMSMYM